MLMTLLLRKRHVDAHIRATSTEDSAERWPPSPASWCSVDAGRDMVYPLHLLTQALLCACAWARAYPARGGETASPPLLVNAHGAQAWTRGTNIGVGRNTPPSAPKMPSSTILAIRGPVAVSVTQVRWSKLPSSLVDTHAPPVGPRRMCSRPCSIRR